MPFQLARTIFPLLISEGYPSGQLLLSTSLYNMLHRTVAKYQVSLCPYPLPSLPSRNAFSANVQSTVACVSRQCSYKSSFIHFPAASSGPSLRKRTGFWVSYGERDSLICISAKSLSPFSYHSLAIGVSFLGAQRDDALALKNNRVCRLPTLDAPFVVQPIAPNPAMK